MRRLIVRSSCPLAYATVYRHRSGACTGPVGCRSVAGPPPHWGRAKVGRSRPFLRTVRNWGRDPGKNLVCCADLIGEKAPSSPSIDAPTVLAFRTWTKVTGSRRPTSLLTNRVWFCCLLRPQIASQRFPTRVPCSPFALRVLECNERPSCPEAVSLLTTHASWLCRLLASCSQVLLHGGVRDSSISAMDDLVLR